MKTQVERMLRVFVVLGLMLLSAVMASLITGSPPSKADPPAPASSNADRWSLLATELEGHARRLRVTEERVAALEGLPRLDQRVAALDQRVAALEVRVAQIRFAKLEAIPGDAYHSNCDEGRNAQMCALMATVKCTHNGYSAGTLEGNVGPGWRYGLWCFGL